MLHGRGVLVSKWSCELEGAGGDDLVGLGENFVRGDRVGVNEPARSLDVS